MLTFYLATVTMSDGSRVYGRRYLVCAALPVLQTTSSRNAHLHQVLQSPYRCPN